MRRDWNLIRQILFEVEKLPAGESTKAIQIDGFDVHTITEHVRMLVRKDLLIGNVYNTYDGSTYVIEGMSWEGHDFLDNARNDTIWKKVMAESRAKGTSTTVVVLNGLLAKAAQKYAGLD